MPACRAGLWERVSLGDRHAGELVQPKRLIQQVHTDEELLHSRLETRVKAPPEERQQVSSSTVSRLTEHIYLNGELETFTSNLNICTPVFPYLKVGKNKNILTDDGSHTPSSLGSISHLHLWSYVTFAMDSRQLPDSGYDTGLTLSRPCLLTSLQKQEPGHVNVDDKLRCSFLLQCCF